MLQEESFKESDEEEIVKDHHPSSLPYLQGSTFASILEDTITELRVLSECNNELRIAKTISDMKLLIALKYGVRQLPVTDELESIDPHNLNCNKYKLDKLAADRKYLSDVLSSTYVGLSVNRSFEPLKEYVKKWLDEKTYRATLAEDEIRNRGIRHDLNKQLRQQRNYIKTKIYETDVTIDELRTTVEDTGLYSETRSRYVENWQRARTEQHLQTIYDKEIVPSRVIEYFKQRADYEQRVHAEVELLTNIRINETLEKVESWMNKYDTDMEAIDLKIQLKKNEYQDMFDRRVNLEQTLEKHDQMMKDWIHFKEEREKARLYREKMMNSAIIIQAWWRGLLVRRQLGPYKVKKKKGDAAKKK
ncbi:dynein regulatory complex protein 9-like [Leptidea sinapis]|uniref:dynein regulatory complex protein 9-like n=1 Tax=Leptidea sinapis TaxID=189913 RepID=UPI0021C39B0A|nr:dynein regulatory complex protein 9-like [Leptidea sinapis]